MATHAGAIVEKAVRRSGISIAELARQVGVNRRSLYNWFAQETLSIDSICKIGFAIGYDFSADFPGQLNAAKLIQSFAFNQMNESHEAENVHFWKSKYIDLLEKYNELLLKRTS